MIDCLHRQELYHFFIPSNLFAGMDQDVASEIAMKIQLIRKEPFEINVTKILPMSFTSISTSSIKKEMTLSIKRSESVRPNKIKISGNMKQFRERKWNNLDKHTTIQQTVLT
jgi:hypothetical protein